MLFHEMFPRTVYAVSVVRTHRWVPGRFVLSSLQFSVSGDQPLTREEAINRCLAETAKMWDESKDGPLDEYAASEARTVNAMLLTATRS